MLFKPDDEGDRAPKRVCDACSVGLRDKQADLRQQLSRANQELEIDSSAISVPQINFLLQNEIVHAALMIEKFCSSSVHESAGKLRDILSEVKGIVFLTTVKAGFVFSGTYGTGLVICKLADGSWSAPSAITTSGVGWGWQIGAEVSEVMSFLPSDYAVAAFKSRGQVALGAGIQGSVGPIGGGFGSDLSAGNKGAGMSYSFLLSQGLFVGASLDATGIAARKDVNQVFYGEEVSTSALLSGDYPKPRAAEPLYRALEAVMQTM